MSKKISIFCKGEEKVVDSINMLETTLLREYNNEDVLVHFTNEITKVVTVYYLSIINRKIYYTYVKNTKKNLFNIKEILVEQ